MRQQTVTIDRNENGFTVTYSTRGSNGQVHRGRGDRFESESEMVMFVQEHCRRMENMGYQVTVEDNTQ